MWRFMIVAGFTTEINTHILSTESWLVCCQCPLFVSILFDLMIIFASTRQISNEISVWVAWFFFIEYICDAKEQNGLGIGSKRVHYLFASCLLWMPLGLWINKMIFFFRFFVVEWSVDTLSKSGKILTIIESTLLPQWYSNSDSNSNWNSNSKLMLMNS